MNNCHTIRIVVAVAGLLGLAAQSSLAEQPLLAGVLQVDGNLLPFAEFKEGSWQTSWKAEEARNGYPSVAYSTWYLSQKDGTKTLKVSRAVKVPMHCGELWGLKTDFPKQQVPKNTFPVQKVGIAFTSPQHFSTMSAKGIDSKTRGKITAFLRNIFEPLDKEARKRFEDTQKPSPMTLEAAYRSNPPINGSRWYYVEAKRQGGETSESLDYSCPRISFLTGWLEETSSGNFRAIQKGFFATDCDMKGVQTERPFGILTLGDRLFVFSQANGYENESYTISSLEPEGLHSLLEGSGGGC